MSWLNQEGKEQVPCRTGHLHATEGTKCHQPLLSPQGAEDC